MRNWKVAALIGVIAGAIAGVSITRYLAEEKLAEYSSDRLNDMELLSWEFFREQPPETAMAAQAHYLLYSHRAWAAGGITDEAYAKAQALAFTRHCVSQKKILDNTASTTLCTEAKKSFLQWQPCGDFEKFKSKIEKGIKIP